ncbi:STAS domain-containing protein [Saccharopolyspora erythraea]|nr:STAS domain-containing protein [Saccharopolyspora erythraea]
MVLRADGALDGVGEADFAELMRQLLHESERLVVLDLSAVSFMTTAGAVALLEADCRARIQGVALVIVTSPAVDRLLGLIEVADRFTYAPSVAAGLTRLEAAGAWVPQPRPGSGDDEEA